MALDRNEHQILREIQKMGIVEEANYIGSPNIGEPPRIYVQFEKSVKDIPSQFQEYTKEKNLAIIRDRWENMETEPYLFVDLQDKDEL